MSISEGTEQTAAGWTADASTFGARLALVRLHMGWGNIAKAAKECGLPTDSWRNWETDGRLPQRMTTIAMTIATRTGCDVDWLLWGPEGKRAASVAPNGRYVGQVVIAQIAGPENHLKDSADRSVRQDEGPAYWGRAVTATRPRSTDTRRPVGSLSR